MEGFSNRYLRLTSGKFSGMVLDDDGGVSFPRVITPSGWVDFEGTGGDFFDSIPLSNSEVAGLDKILS